MKQFHLLLTMVVAACLTSACGSSGAQKITSSSTPSASTPERKVDLGPNINSDSNSGVNPSASNTTGSPVSAKQNSNSNTTIQTNGNAKAMNVPTMPNDGSAVSGDGPGNRLRSRSRGERIRIPEDPSATPPPMTYRKAPENSQFAAYMDKSGNVVETRIFKSHPQLQRADVIWADPKNKVLKVTLRNGRVVERKGAGLASLTAASSAEILKAVGLDSDVKRAGRRSTSP